MGEVLGERGRGEGVWERGRGGRDKRGFLGSVVHIGFLAWTVWHAARV